MAQAIALHELAARSAGAGPVVPVNIVSAGTSAYDGDAATRETIDAVKSIGIDPSPLTRHRSKGLTARMIDDAEVIYGMTANHVRAALSLAPEAAGKTKMLDPEGEDVPDPIGGSLEVYTRTARRLQELIRRRLAEAD
jgi:protein-tyrosine phosphatase